MSDWVRLNKARVLEPSRTVSAAFISTEADGFSGLFRLVLDGKMVRCIASDQLGWKHVSVSLEYERKPPSWSIMAKVKDLFWEDDETVVQYHPAKKDYVNFHEGCLHLWQYIGGGPFEMPLPHWYLVGPK